MNTNYKRKQLRKSWREDKRNEIISSFMHAKSLRLRKGTKQTDKEPPIVFIFILFVGKGKKRH